MEPQLSLGSAVGPPRPQRHPEPVETNLPHSQPHTMSPLAPCPICHWGAPWRCSLQPVVTGVGGEGTSEGTSFPSASLAERSSSAPKSSPRKAPSAVPLGSADGAGCSRHCVMFRTLLRAKPVPSGTKKPEIWLSAGPGRAQAHPFIHGKLSSQRAPVPPTLVKRCGVDRLGMDAAGCCHKHVCADVFKTLLL